MNNKFLSFFNRYRFVRRLFGSGGGWAELFGVSRSAILVRLGISG